MYTASLRMADDLATQLKAAAEREGVTFAQYVRDAAVARLIHGLTAAEVTELKHRVERLEEALGIEP